MIASFCSGINSLAQLLRALRLFKTYSISVLHWWAEQASQLTLPSSEVGFPNYEQTDDVAGALFKPLFDAELQDVEPVYSIRFIALMWPSINGQMKWAIKHLVRTIPTVQGSPAFGNDRQQMAIRTLRNEIIQISNRELRFLYN